MSVTFKISWLRRNGNTIYLKKILWYYGRLQQIPGVNSVKTAPALYRARRNLSAKSGSPHEPASCLDLPSPLNNQSFIAALPLPYTARTRIHPKHTQPTSTGVVYCHESISARQVVRGQNSWRVSHDFCLSTAAMPRQQRAPSLFLIAKVKFSTSCALWFNFSMAMDDKQPAQVRFNLTQVRFGKLSCASQCYVRLATVRFNYV